MPARNAANELDVGSVDGKCQRAKGLCSGHAARERQVSGVKSQLGTGDAASRVILRKTRTSRCTVVGGKGASWDRLPPLLQSSCRPPSAKRPRSPTPSQTMHELGIFFTFLSALDTRESSHDEIILFTPLLSLRRRLQC